MKQEIVYVTSGGIRFSTEESANKLEELVRLYEIMNELTDSIAKIKGQCKHTDHFVSCRYSDYQEKNLYRIQCKCCGSITETVDKREVPNGSEFL